MQACASVSRQSSANPAEFKGLLMFEPEVGAPLVLALDRGGRLTTSTVVRIEPAPDDGVYVDTANNRYLVRRLFPTGVRTQTGEPRPT
jgi:hypothetical protein